MTVKIFIDPGHGGKDPGTVGNGLQEKDLTLKIALKIRDILKAEYTGHTIRMSRTTDKTVTLKQRTDMANAWNADFFLSVHINAGGGTGYEDYIYVKLSNSTKTAKLRQIIHQEIMSAIPGIRDRGMKKANFHVLRETKMPAILTENLFIDQLSDAKKLKDEDFINQIARGHAVGLAKALKLSKKSPKQEEGVSKMPEKDEQTLSEWAQEAVDLAIELGITDGTRMKEPATREEVITMIMRAFFLLNSS